MLPARQRPSATRRLRTQLLVGHSVNGNVPPPHKCQPSEALAETWGRTHKTRRAMRLAGSRIVAHCASARTNAAPTDRVRQQAYPRAIRRPRAHTARLGGCSKATFGADAPLRSASLRQNSSDVAGLRPRTSKLAIACGVLAATRSGPPCRRRSRGSHAVASEAESLYLLYHTQPRSARRQASLFMTVQHDVTLRCALGAASADVLAKPAWSELARRPIALTLPTAAPDRPCRGPPPAEA